MLLQFKSNKSSGDSLKKILYFKFLSTSSVKFKLSSKIFNVAKCLHFMTSSIMTERRSKT